MLQAGTALPIKDDEVTQTKRAKRDWNVGHLRIATAAAGVALWSWNVDTGEIELDERAHALWGIPEDRLVTFEVLSQRIHPEDLDRVGSAFEATRAVAGPYEIDFRIQRDGVESWVSARGQGADVGIVERVMFGIFMDVTERKQAEEARELLAGEMSHRVKNLFAVTTALTSIAARSTSTTAEMATDLIQRMTALSSAHNLVRPLTGQRVAQPVYLSELLTVLLAPYDDTDNPGTRISVQGPEIRVGEAGANALALITHELATNSIKYGALSIAGGTLDVSYGLKEADVLVVWAECDGPEVPASAEREGFGTRLISRSLSGQLAGSAAFKWLDGGLVVNMRMSKGRLAA